MKDVQKFYGHRIEWNNKGGFEEFVKHLKRCEEAEKNWIKLKEWLHNNRDYFIFNADKRYGYYADHTTGDSYISQIRLDMTNKTITKMYELENEND